MRQARACAPGFVHHESFIGPSRPMPDDPFPLHSAFSSCRLFSSCRATWRSCPLHPGTCRPCSSRRWTLHRLPLRRLPERTQPCRSSPLLLRTLQSSVVSLLISFVG